MKNKAIISITIFILLIINIIEIQALPELTLTLQTNKTLYNFGETVTLNGTLTDDGTPINDALVAIQIVDSADETLIYRTLNTGTEPQTTWYVEITEVLPLGTDFKRGELVDIKVTVKNNAEEDKYVYLTLTLSYMLSNEMPFEALLYFEGYIPPGQITFIPSVEIPQDAPICPVKVYANAYAILPKNVGYAYCPEKSATFYITNSESSTSQFSEYQLENLNGEYSLTFSLPDNFLRVGNYTIYVGTLYRDQVFTYCSFGVVLLGDINDDGIVDIFDAVMLSRASGSQPGDLNWNPKCDLNDDGIVDIFDAVILAANAGKQAKK